MSGDYVTPEERQRLGVGALEILHLIVIERETKAFKRPVVGARRPVAWIRARQCDDAEFRDGVLTYEVHDAANEYLGFICRRRDV